MTPEQEAAIDWSLCTWEGSRIQQHNEFRALSAQEKLRQMDELCRLTDYLLEKGRLAREQAAAQVTTDCVANYSSAGIGPSSSSGNSVKFR